MRSWEDGRGLLLRGRGGCAVWALKVVVVVAFVVIGAEEEVYGKEKHDALVQGRRDHLNPLPPYRNPTGPQIFSLSWLLAVIDRLRGPENSLL